MNTILETAAQGPLAARLLELTALLAAAWLLHAFHSLLAGNPRWRVVIWRGTVAGSFAAILVAAFGPQWRVAALPPARRNSVATVLGVGDPSAAFRLRQAGPQLRSLSSSASDASSIPQSQIQDPQFSAALGAQISQPQSEIPIPHSQFPSLAISLWLFVSALLLLRWHASGRRVRSLLRQSALAPGFLRRILCEECANFDLPSVPDLRVASGMFSPFLCGWLRPAIVIPETMATPGFAAELPGVLAHELAHIQGGDLLWMHLIRAFQAALWWHPLAWRVGAAHLAACERICDAAASSAADAELYSRTLARVALELHGAAPAYGLPLARPAQIMQRLAWLARGAKAAPLPRPLRAAVFAALLLLAAAAGALRLEPSTALAADTIQIRNGQPVLLLGGANDAPVLEQVGPPIYSSNSGPQPANPRSANPQAALPMPHLEPPSDEALARKQLFEDAANAYASDPDKARQIWGSILQDDPDNALATAWLRSTQRESDKRHGFSPLNEDESILGYDGPPVTVQTGRVITIAQFMELLSRATNGKIRCQITPGVDAQVFMSAVDQPPLKALDAALKPTELYWSVDPAGLVLITDRPARAGFALSAWEASQFKSLMQAGDQPRGLWGGTDAPSRHFNLQLDVQSQRILSTGTGVDIKRIDSLIAAMRKMEPIDTARIPVTRTYQLDSANSSRILGMIESSVYTRSNGPLGTSPNMFFLEGSAAVVRNTQQAIDRINAQLLLPPPQTGQLPQRLITDSFNLRPDNADKTTPEALQARALKMVGTIKQQLYGETGDPGLLDPDDKRAAAYDAAALQLTVTDTPEKIKIITEYTDSMRNLETRQ